MIEPATRWLCCAVAALVAVGCDSSGREAATSASAPAVPPPAPARATRPAVAGGTAHSLNGCERAGADDYRGEETVTVRFGGELGHAYLPRCVRVNVGATLRFEGPFSLHPLAPGRLVEGLPELDESSSIPSVEAGELLELAVLRAGELGYFCNYHVDEGMLGAIFVEAKPDDS